MDWDSLPLYQKIGIEGAVLTSRFPDYLNKISVKDKALEMQVDEIERYIDLLRVEIKSLILIFVQKL